MISSLAHLASPDVAQLLAKVPVAVVPCGSVEQHGPHLPCGTDTIAATSVAQELATRLGALYAEVGPYGITPLHAGRPGTISLGRRTFEMLLRDVCGELVRMGAGTLVLVNWHEGNTASLNAVATDLQKKSTARVFIAQACYVAERIYAGEGGALTHGGSIETLAVMAHDPSLVHVERAAGRAQPEAAAAADSMRRSPDVYGFVTDVSEISEDGWYGDPTWATTERSATFPTAVVDEILARLRAIGALGDRS
jgi:creatinine amidohydrolase